MKNNNLMQSEHFNSSEKISIFILVFLQFTMVLDFMVMAPLGATIMPEFNINPQQFSLIVSSYAFSAFISSALVSKIADRFNRKLFLLIVYVGFLGGTLLCASVNHYELLLLSRILTGCFGGVLASIISAIITDLFPEHKRGRVFGFTQGSFGLCQVLGLPLSLYFSNRWGWHAPFIFVFVLGVILFAVIYLKLQPIYPVLKSINSNQQFSINQKGIVVPSWIKTKNVMLSFLGTMIVTLGGYLLMPFASAYNVNNLNMSMSDLPLYYFITGFVVILFCPLIGKMSDLLGCLKVFSFGVVLTIITVLVYTNYKEAHFYLLCFTNILLFTGFFSMIISFQSLGSQVPKAENRGAFMSINASLQQLAGGLSVLLSGFIITKSPEGKLEHVSALGLVLTTFLIVSFFVINKIKTK